MATPRVTLAARPPFRNLALGPPPVFMDSSGNIVEFPTIGGRPLYSVACTPKQFETGLARALARLAYQNDQGRVLERDVASLRRFVPRSPVHPRRIPRLRRLGITDRDIKLEAARALAAAPWDSELQERVGDSEGVVEIRLERLPAYLNREVWDRLTDSNSDARRQQRVQERLETEFALRERGRRSLAESETLLNIRRRAIEAKAQTLTEAQRSVYLLVKRDELTPKEAGHELGISAAAARNRLKRALKSLAS